MKKAAHAVQGRQAPLDLGALAGVKGGEKTPVLRRLDLEGELGSADLKSERVQ